MNTAHVDRAFSGSIAQLYERYLVPLIFEPYAADLARRVVAHAPSRVLEVAAGTGVVTRRLASALPADASIVATDLNQPMLDHAASIGTSRAVHWRQADAMQLPFADASFDALVCQFGAMFFPDKVKAYAEAWRVLRPGGVLLFNVWDAIEHNEFADTVIQALAPLYAQDPPRFLARTPHGYHDLAVVTDQLAAAGFGGRPQFSTLSERSSAPSPREPAIAYCQGTPLRNEIEARGAPSLEAATSAAADAIAARFGGGAVSGEIRAHIIEIVR